MFNAIFKAVVSSSLVAAAPLPPTHQDKNPFIPSKLRVFYSSPDIDDKGAKPPVPILLEESGEGTPQVGGLEYTPEDKTLRNNIADSDIGEDIPSVFVALAPGHASAASAGRAEDDIPGVVDNEGMVDGYSYDMSKKPIFPGKEPKVQARTLRNEDESNTSETTSDRKSKRNQTADTSTPSDPSLDFGILDRNRTPNDRELDDLDCEGTRPLIPAEVDFPDLIDECLGYGSCPYYPIKCWNTSLVTDMSGAFRDQKGFCADISAWDVSSVTSMAFMFQYATNFNQPVDSWDVSSVTSMKRMFYRATRFNQPVDSLDVSSVNNMNKMFFAAYEFNQPVDSWDVSSVTNMSFMFDLAFYFNQPVDSWDVSSVTSMNSMFRFVYKFNQPVDSWDVSSVTNMRYMFDYAYNFNQPVDSWDVSSVNNMRSMFQDAQYFNQRVDTWDVSTVTSMRRMFRNAEEFNQCLSTWADKVPPKVNTKDMFQLSSCPNIGSKVYTYFESYDVPDPNGPWCQDADVCPNDCENNPAPFSLQTSCEEIATLLPNTINQLCDIGIAKDCPELCPGNEICPCADFILPFSFKDETTSCTEVAGFKELKQEKKCSKKKIADNCPGVCTCGTF